MKSGLQFRSELACHYCHHPGSCSAVSILKWCVGQSFFVGAALRGRPPSGHPHRGAPTARLCKRSLSLSLSLSLARELAFFNKSHIQVLKVLDLAHQVVFELLLEPAFELPHALATDAVLVADLLQRERLFSQQALGKNDLLLALERARKLRHFLADELVVLGRRHLFFRRRPLVGHQV